MSKAKVVTLPFPVTNPEYAATYGSPCIHAVMCMTHRTKQNGLDMENWRMLRAFPSIARAAKVAARIARHA